MYYGQITYNIDFENYQVKVCYRWSHLYYCRACGMQNSFNIWKKYVTNMSHCDILIWHPCDISLTSLCDVSMWVVCDITVISKLCHICDVSMWGVCDITVISKLCHICDVSMWGVCDITVTSKWCHGLTGKYHCQDQYWVYWLYLYSRETLTMIEPFSTFRQLGLFHISMF